MRRLITIVLVLLTLSFSGSRLEAEQAPPGVLSIVPADAWAVTWVRHTAEMDQKLNTLAQQLNFPMFFPQPLVMGVSMLGFPYGLDSTGGVGLVVLPAPSFDVLQNHTVALFPTKDFKQLVSLLELTEVEPGISKTMLHDQEVFLAHKTGYALLSLSPDAIKAVLASKTSFASKLSKHQLKHYAKDDLVIWINAAPIINSEPFQAVAPMLQMVGGFGLDMLKQLRTMALSLRITPAGLQFGFYMDSISGSEVFRVIASQRGQTGSLMLGIPQDRMVLSYGAVWNEESARFAADMIAKSLDTPQLQMLKLEPTKLEQFKTTLLSLARGARAVCFGVSQLPEGPSGLFSLAKVATVEGDSKQILASLAELVALVKGGLILDEQAAPFLSLLEYKPAAETIDGVSVDHLFFNLTGGFADEADAMPREIAMALKILGKEGILFRLGAVDAKNVAMTFGGGAERFRTVAALVKGKKAPLADDPGIQRCQAYLPSSRSEEGYLAVDHLLSLITVIAKIADEPMPPLSLGKLNAPVAFASEPVEPGGWQSECFIPMELMIAAKDLYTNATTPTPDQTGTPPDDAQMQKEKGMGN
ncbi:MAG: hypothetical protein KAV82_15925 [Phycisphaerae bacterium]|nr:hypothetical protein [Phycisphaerae bacterium]